MTARASALRDNREFRLLWAGQALSAFGSSMSGVALPLALLAAGRPVTAVAALGTAVAAAGLAARLPAGVVSDRYGERRLLIGCDLVRLAAIGSVAVWAAVGDLPLWLAFGAVVVSAGAAEVFKPTQLRVVRRIVTEDQLPSAISLNLARSYGAEIAGPAAAGLLIGLRPELPFALDALSFLASALCVAAAVHGTTAAAPRGWVGAPAHSGPGEGDASGAAAAHDAPTHATRRDGRFWAGFGAGWRHLARDPFLRRATLFFCALTVAFTATGTAMLLGVATGSGGARAAGWAVSTAAVAGLVGSLAAPRIQRLLPLNAVVTAGPAVAAALLLASWLTGGTLLFIAGFSAMCLLVPVINAAVGTIMATCVPEEIYGRVVTANDFIVQLLQPCGPLLAGLLISRSLPTGALVLGAGFAALAMLALTLPAPTVATPSARVPART